MKFLYYQVNAFTQKPFGGNPAGVCPLLEWLSEEQMQAVAAENRLSETAFFVREKEHYHIRWFTPVMEVDLCGHATLASAAIIFELFEKAAGELLFQSKGGKLAVRRVEDKLELDFPAWPREEIPCPDELAKGLGRTPHEIYKAANYLMAVFDRQADIETLEPDATALEKLEAMGIAVTAPGTEADFVSRFFAPRAGIPEDPATGSAQCMLIPYWAERLGKQALFARQLSPRGAEFYTQARNERVGIGGYTGLYLKGEIFLS